MKGDHSAIQPESQGYDHVVGDSLCLSSGCIGGVDEQRHTHATSMQHQQSP